MGVPPSVKARKSDMFVRVQDVGLTHHAERNARASVRADTRVFRSMALTDPMEVPRIGAPIPSPAGVSDEEFQFARREGPLPTVIPLIVKINLRSGVAL